MELILNNLQRLICHKTQRTNQPIIQAIHLPGFFMNKAPVICSSIQVRRTRHAWHCWRSRDELISDVLRWTPTYGRAEAGRPARTYIQQLCEDTGCSPEDFPEAMNDREKWREGVRDIRACITTWWWWFALQVLTLSKSRSTQNSRHYINDPK